MEKRKDNTYDSTEMFHDYASNEHDGMCDDRRDKRRYYRNLIIGSVSSFLIGAIIYAITKALGLGGLILGLLLCLLSGYYASTFC